MADQTCYHDDCDKQEDVKNLTMCIMCFKTYHQSCLGLRQKTTIVMCQTCSRSLFKVPDEVKYMRQSCMKQISDLQQELLAKHNECQQLSEQNKTLRDKVSSLTADVNKAKWEGFIAGEATQTIVFSDSMTKDIDSQKIHSTKIVPISGARIKRIHEEVKRPEYHGAKFDRAVIVAATNDVSDAKGNLEAVPDLLAQYKKMLADVKIIAEEVSVSSLCPRLDVPTDILESFNSGLQVLCQDDDYTFIDNTPAFTCGDGSTNDGYLDNGKGPHLNKAGVNKLARNLKLQTKAGVSDVTKTTSRKQPTEKGSVAATTGRSKTHRAANGAAHSQHRDHQTAWQQDNHQWDEFSSAQYNRDACYLCNEGGHTSVECRHRHQGPLQCRQCGEYGHKAKHHYHMNENY